MSHVNMTCLFSSFIIRIGKNAFTKSIATDPIPKSLLTCSSRDITSGIALQSGLLLDWAFKSLCLVCRTHLSSAHIEKLNRDMIRILPPPLFHSLHYLMRSFVTILPGMWYYFLYTLWPSEVEHSFRGVHLNFPTLIALTPQAKNPMWALPSQVY